MNTKYKKLFFTFILTAFIATGFLFAKSALAQSQSLDVGLEQVSSTIGLPSTDIRIIITNIIRYALGLLGIIALVLIMYGGFVWMTAGGNEERVGTAKKILTNGVIGLIIILSAYAIVSFVMNRLVDATTNSGSVATSTIKIIDPYDPNTKFFYLVNVPNGGDVCIRNVKLALTFNKPVDITSLPGNITVQTKKNYDKKNNIVAAGAWAFDGNDKNTAIFTPQGDCGSQDSGKDCLEASTDYVLDFKNKDNILTTENIKNKALQCAGFSVGGCADIKFKTGSGVDRTNPTITHITPIPPFQQGNNIPVKITYKDDAGVQKVDLMVKGTGDAKGIRAGSVSPSGNCKKTDTVTINWNTASLLAGTYELEAIASDWANLKGSNSTTVDLLAAHCFNGEQDKDENGEDCGGIDCYACDITRITDFSPKDGAPNTLVSIVGYKFGSTTGEVYLQDNTPNKNYSIKAELADCGSASWTDRQVIFKISTSTNLSTSTGIKLITAKMPNKDGVLTKYSDTTRNDVLPKIINFAVTSTTRPGLCSVTNVDKPSSGFGLNIGEPGNLVQLLGFDFGPSFGTVTFGNTYAKVNNWLSARAGVRVPSANSGYVAVKLTNKSQIESNAIRFKVNPVSQSSLPQIDTVSPSVGAKGEYVTITGKNFGTLQGTVNFESVNSNSAPAGEFNFPPGCGKTWSDNKIIVKFPVSGATVSQGEQFRVVVTNITKTPNTQSSLSKDQFKVSNTLPRPGICQISPISGPATPTPSNLKIYGEYFDTNSNVYFWKTGASSSSISGRSKISSPLDVTPLTKGIMVSTTLAQDAKTGPVIVYANQQMSNEINFEVSDCTTKSNSCTTGYHCCSGGQDNGACISDGQLCSGKIYSSGYVWRFSTGKIPVATKVIEKCGSKVPSPSPSRQWNNQMTSADRNNVCLTASLVTEFTTEVDDVDLTGSNLGIEVYECVSSTVTSTNNNCTRASNIPIALYDPNNSNSTINLKSIITSNMGFTTTSMIEAVPATDRWDPNTWYQVVLTSNIEAKHSSSTLSKTNPCTNNSKSAYCYLFKTGTKDCKLKSLYVTPYEYKTYRIEDLLKTPISGLIYRAHGLSDQKCVAMNVSGLSKKWSSASTTFADIYGPTTGTTAQAYSKKNTVGIGLTNPKDAVGIQAVFSTTTNQNQLVTATGISDLFVDLTNPQVVDYGPKCLEACPESKIYVQFNTSMSSRNKQGYISDAIRLYECGDENCLDSGLTRVSTTYYGNCSGATDAICFDDQSTDTFVIKTKLATGTLYKVEVSTPSTDVNNAQLLWTRDELESSIRKPYINTDKKADWRFRVKNNKCSVDRVLVSPLVYSTKSNTDRTIFKSSAYSSPDKCSTSGQLLNPWNLDWSWSSESTAVAKVTEVKTYGSKGFCTSKCIKKGSDVIFGYNFPLCGNKITEAGEDCDPPVAGSCGLTCLYVGNKNTTTTTSTADIGLCGDGFVSSTLGEECDPGKDKNGCDANTCLNSGSNKNTAGTQVGASICGSGGVGIGEDCDLGITPTTTMSSSSLLCSDKCLHQGTRLSANWCFDNDNPGDYEGFATTTFKNACQYSLSQCGDGVNSPGEDDKCETTIFGFKADGCSDYCLTNSSTPPYKECDPAKEWCDSNGQNAGSSMNYTSTSPSFCGNNKTEDGEDAWCESMTGDLTSQHIFTNPWALVEAVGKGSLVNTTGTIMQKTNIVASTTNALDYSIKKGKGEYQITCGFISDQECSDANGGDANKGYEYGVANNSCCYKRPKMLSVYPANTSTIDNEIKKSICPNTAIKIKFDSIIDKATLANNFIIAQGFASYSTNNCTTTEDVTNNIKLANANYNNLPWYKKLIAKAVDFFKSFFSNQANAEINGVKQWCSGSDLGIPTVEIDNNGFYSTINVRLTKPLATSTSYTILLKEGIKDIYGVSIGKDRTITPNKNLKWQFKTASDICRVKTIDTQPSQIYFNKYGATSTLTGVAYTDTKQEIQPIVGHYAWEYRWAPFTNDYVVLATTTTTIAPNKITSKNLNGEINVRATAHVTEDNYGGSLGQVATDRSNIIIMLCENAWPPAEIYNDWDGDGKGEDGPYTIFPYEDRAGNNDLYLSSRESFIGDPIPRSSATTNGYMNFKTYYCADSGNVGKTDDLPYLRPTVQSGPNVTSVTSSLKSFIFTNDKNNDAIFINIFPNAKNLSLKEWFTAQSFYSTSITQTSVDGYEAITDGNNVYIDALNYDKDDDNSGGSLYSNIYLIGINSDASVDTRKVFTSIINNFKFNVNLTNYHECGIEIQNPDPNRKCKTDLDCSADIHPNISCSAQIDKIKINYLRLKGLESIASALPLNAPALTKGSLLIGQTVSTWPSWQNTLASELQVTKLAVDPVNKLAKVGTCKTTVSTTCVTDDECGPEKCVIHDATTGWGTEDLRLSFVCDQSSLAYRYIYNASSTDYTIRARFENPFGRSVITNEISNWWGNTGFVANFVNTSSFVLDKESGICLVDKEIVSRNSSNTCGDNIKSITEDCEVGWTDVTDLCNTNSTTITKTCNTTTCRWNPPVTTQCKKDNSLCGNGKIDFGEACDDGSSKTSGNGTWNKCNKSCSNELSNVGTPGYCGDGYLQPNHEFCDPHDKINSKYKVYNSTKDKTKTCSMTCQDYGGYCGDGVIQFDSSIHADEQCEADVSCINSTTKKSGTQFCDTGCKWKETDTAGKPICSTTVAVAPAKTVVTGCGNGIVEGYEKCDWGQDTTKSQYNNATCTPKYGETCEYCDNDCKVVYVQPTQYCGDGKVSATEVCDKDSSGIYVASLTTLGAGQFVDINKITHGGYKLKSCTEETASSLLWLSGNSRQGTKDCASDCKTVINKCIECGVDPKNGGSTVSGQLLNVIDPKSKNPLLVNYITNAPKLGSGDVMLYLTTTTVAARHFISPVDFNAQSSKDFTKYSIRLKAPNDTASTTLASINNDSNCSFGTSSYLPNYGIKINGGTEYGFDFDVLSSEAIKKEPWRYDLLLSPIILKTVRSNFYLNEKNSSGKDMLDEMALKKNLFNGTVTTTIQARPKDVRLVVSWVGSNNNFQSGFLVPYYTKYKTITRGSTSIKVPDITSVSSFEGLSNFNNNTTTGLTYYDKSSTSSYNIWYHDYGSTSSGLITESYTINTDKTSMGNFSSLITSGSNMKDGTDPIYAFYIRIPNADMDNYRSTANLKVDIYIPEDYIAENWQDCCTDASCSTRTSSYKQFCLSDYRLFSRPYKTIYLSTAAASANSSQTSYWHVLNLKSNSNTSTASIKSSIEEVNAISTGPQYFKYDYSNQYITK